MSLQAASKPAKRARCANTTGSQTAEAHSTGAGATAVSGLSAAVGPAATTEISRAYSAGFPLCRPCDLVAGFLVVRMTPAKISKSKWNWGSIDSSVSPTYIEGLFKAVHAVCGPRYVVDMRTITCSADLWELAANFERSDDDGGGAETTAAHATSAQTTAIPCGQYLRNKEDRERVPVHGMYFLWPTRFRDADHCDTDATAATAADPAADPAAAAAAAATESGTDGVGVKGFVEEDAFFNLMRVVERNFGVATAFPHPEPLYRILLSKQWQSLLCSAPAFCVPPTTVVPISAIVADPLCAASAAMSALNALGLQRWCQRYDCLEEVATLGVAKLGYSWEALDVRAFDSIPALARALVDLGPHQTGFFGDSVIVQAYVPAICELRVFVVDGRPAHWYFCKYQSRTPPHSVAAAEGSGEVLTFSDWAHYTTPEEAAVAWCGGDASLLYEAIVQAHQLVDIWIQWMQAVCATPAPPPALRMDFLVGHSGSDSGANVVVTTLELTEMGFSMFGWEAGPRLVFSALARHILKKSQNKA